MERRTKQNECARDISIVTLTTNLWIQSRSHARIEALTIRKFLTISFLRFASFVGWPKTSKINVTVFVCECRVTKTFCNDYKSGGPNRMPHSHKSGREQVQGIVAKRFPATTIYWKQLKFLIKKYQNINLVAPIWLARSLPVVVCLSLCACEYCSSKAENETQCESYARGRGGGQKQKAISVVCTIVCVCALCHTPHIVLSGLSRIEKEREKVSKFRRTHGYVAKIVW